MTTDTEIVTLRKRLDATFERASTVGPDSELQSDFARYLCVLVSGYIERAVVHIILEHVRESESPTLERFVTRRTRRIGSAYIDRIRGLLNDFDEGWKKEFNRSLPDEERDAVNSIVDQRNEIAHGGSVDITYLRIKEYYQRAQRVIDRVAEVCGGRAG